MASANVTTVIHANGYLESVKILNQCSTTCTAGTYYIVITGLKNPDYVSTLYTGDFTVDTVDVDDGIINRGKNTTAVGTILPHLFDTVPAYDRSAPELGASVTLSLNFTTDYDSYTTGFIKLEFPKDAVIFNSSLVPVLTYGASNTALSYTNVTYGTTYTTIYVPNWCSGNTAITCPAGTTF